jgi:hypothetical protein
MRGLCQLNEVYQEQGKQAFSTGFRPSTRKGGMGPVMTNGLSEAAGALLLVRTLTPEDHQKLSQARASQLPSALRIRKESGMSGLVTFLLSTLRSHRAAAMRMVGPEATEVALRALLSSRMQIRAEGGDLLVVPELLTETISSEVGNSFVETKVRGGVEGACVGRG